MPLFPLFPFVVPLVSLISGQRKLLFTQGNALHNEVIGIRRIKDKRTLKKMSDVPLINR